MTLRKSGSWLLDQPINRKVMFALSSLLTIFILACLVTFYTFQRVSDVRAANVRTFQTVEQILSISRGMREKDVAAKNYMLYAESDRLTRFQEVSEQFNNDLASLESLIEDSLEQKLLLHEAQALAQDWQVAAMALIAAVPVDEVARLEYLRSFSAAGTTGLGEGADRIIILFERMLTLERGQRDQSLASVNRLQSLSYNINLSALIASIAAGFLIAWLTERIISRPVRDLAERMTTLAQGDQQVDVIGTNRGDEIGDIARALQVFKAQSIQIERTGWIRTQVAEVSDLMPRADSPEQLAERLLSELASRLGVQVAVFYLLVEDKETAESRLELYCSWGLQQRKHLGSSYRIGEGLVGQCVRERKPIVLEQVPEDYIRVHSGLGEITPRAIVVYPLALEQRVLGVLELGSLAGFDAARQSVLDELAPRVALVLDNLRRARHTEELLHQTQLQARRLEVSEEELRNQQTALYAANDELQAKTVELEEQAQRLQVSEEELRVQAEELQASNEELRLKTDTLNEQKRLLEQLQIETQRRAEELAKASQYKSDFLANMSHELRTPLNSLLILSRSLSDNETGNLDAEEVESARVIHQSGSNLLRLINDILDLSKIEAGKMEIASETVNVRELVTRLQRSFRPMANDRSLGFEITLADDLPETMVSDPARIEQIATNLLGNAFKFTREGAVQLIVMPADRHLAAQAGLGTLDALAMHVIDTGIGIDPARLGSMFEPFEQADASNSRQYGGSGLGLSIARRVAQLLGGTILAQSEPGKGSTFTLVLPLQPRTQPAQASTTPPAPRLPAPTAKPRPAPRAQPQSAWIPDDRDQIKPGDVAILAIEDDPQFARVLVDLIRRKGYRALAAGDGEQGLELVRRHRPTGVILDVMLPGMNGWEVIEQMKEDEQTRAIPVHFISAVDESTRGQAMGAVGFLTKPVDRNSVMEAFERLLAHAEHRTRHVLLIDDDEDSRKAITTLIASEQVRVVEVLSAEDGLVRLREEEFDCVVLDLGLPGMDGFDFLDVAARSGPLPPVVIYSARELSSDESLRLRQHTDSIVIKGSRSSERLLDEVSLFMHSIRPSGARVVKDVDPGISGRCVLVVDDDMRNVFALSKALRDRGVNVLMAQDGIKALRQLRDNPSIELVLMDIMMPGMDGYETTREIRKQPRYAKLPIIAITAKAMPDDRDKCLEAGANDYLAKPIDIDKLMSMLRVWLQG